MLDAESPAPSSTQDLSPFFYTLTDHARQRLAVRHIPVEAMYAALAQPPLVHSPDRAYYSAPINLRTVVVVVTDPSRRLVVTVEYRRRNARLPKPH